MTEPVLFGFPLSLLFLYFVIYSFLGWIMETTYCSILEKRFVARGFLYGPICPIYGVGVLMMICWFAPFTGNPVVFYLVATAGMSAWEYFVGWFLEATTHIKYWDYSMYKFNLNGRICLWVCLMWGVLAYAVIFWVHPFMAGLVELLPLLPRRITAAALLAVLLVDAIATIRELALVTRLLRTLSQAGDELQVQLALGRAELSDKLGEARENISDRLNGAVESLTGKLTDARETLTDRLESAKTGRESAHEGEHSTAALRARYNELLSKAERISRHLRYSYSGMSSRRWSDALEQLTAASRRSREERSAKRERRRAKHAAKKSGGQPPECDT